MRRYQCPLWLALLGCFAAVDPSHALPLTPVECEQVRTEQRGLESSGVTEDMARGAEWARANLSPDRLQRVARWIELQEKVLFRCPRPKPPPEPATAAAADGQQPTEPQKKKKKQPPGDAEPKPKPAAAAASETGDGAQEPPAPARPKPKPQKKPKVDDAYRPPAPFSGDELQHMTPGGSTPAPSGAALAP